LAIKTKTLFRPSNLNIVENEPLIVAKNLGIKYEGEKERRGDFKSLVHSLVSINKEPKFEPVWALRGVSFSGYPGDVLGVIGPNGAGKTTLCRAILELMKPDMGSIKIRGKVSSLLSLGTGFNKEASGRENIVLNGLMLGLSREKLNHLMPTIEEFSGLGRFLDHPIKHYSTGMKARLGFSIAAAMEPEIMVIDEVLGTGDEEFKERAVKRMNELVSGAKIVVVVTHDIDFVEKYCTRALWLDNGKVTAIGEALKVAASYRENVTSMIKYRKKIFSLRETRTEIGKEEIIRVKNLGIRFKLGRDPFWALKNVNLTVFDKEILGIIGPNGAGKTTFCRVLGGLYRPDEGTVKIKGDITALLSFNLGFNNLLSGYDNIYLSGMMMGIPKDKIKKLEKEIIEFAELEKVIHKPVKEYSSGMKSRLGFSIAAMLKPDIFVIDEALSAGDMAFREKAASRMQDMLADAKTVVLVTHSMSVVEKVCTRAIWLQKGTVCYDGNPKEAVSRYKESVQRYLYMKKMLPMKRDARLQQAVRKFGDGDYKLAEGLLEEFLKEHPHDLAVLTQYAEIADASMNHVQAKERWERAVQTAELLGEKTPEKAEQRLKDIIREEEL
jgi:teichoic acid transport system ATP-binding protein